MTDLIANLSLGLQVALSLKNLWYCFLGCFIGTVDDGRITRLEEYVDGGQAGALSALLRGG